ncbi:MAG TPA: hypothetical protein VFJ43_09920 [Bacteroidia bacterium]|nr:hypothetical protein [Bacteroidia bacterium]
MKRKTRKVLWIESMTVFSGIGVKTKLFALILFFLFHLNSTAQNNAASEQNSGLASPCLCDTVFFMSGNNYFSYERIRSCYLGYLYDYASGRDTLADSLSGIVHKCLEPYFGKWASRVEVLELRDHSYTLDHPDSQMVTNYPICGQLKYAFLCQLHFDDSLVFPFGLFIGKTGNVLDSMDIPHGLDTLRQLRIFPECEICKKAKADKFFSGRLPEIASIHLDYSNQLNVLYYEVEYSDEKCRAIRNDGKFGKESFPVRYIFYNALTGEVLWRTKAIETIERGGDYENRETVFKENKIMSNY